jgi:8-oxo-dGTP pyrophosphatase MutT (NUDIX family)
MRQRYDISAPEARNLESQAIPVGNVIVVDERQRVLLGQRHPDSRYEPGKWNLPGGRCEDGESYEAAALRELREEFGLDLEASSLRYLRGYCCVYDDRVVNAVYFLAHVGSAAPVCVATDEFSDGGFYPLAEVARWDLAFQQQGVIQDYRAEAGKERGP